MESKACFVSTTAITMKCFIIPIAEALATEGIDVTLVCSDDKEMYSLCDKNNMKYCPIHMGRGIDFSGLKSVVAIRKLLKQEKFDLVQYCTPNAAFYTSIAAKMAKVPKRLYCQWGIRYVGMSGFNRKLFKRIEKLVCRLSTDIRAVSPMNKAFAVSEGLYKTDKAKVVGNGGTIGVDMEKFDIAQKALYNSEIRSKYEIPKDALVFGFCGRLSRDKGSNELLAAFKEIISEHMNAFLMIIGDVEANTGIDSALMEWAKKSKNVIITGKIPEAEVYKYYAPMNVLVHPTYREGFGMVIQEAGAYGIPCITTKIPGASEVMVDGESCILVEAKSTVDLTKAMKLLIDDKGLLQQLGDATYQRTKQLYDRPVMLSYQKEDYWELLTN